MTMGLECGKGPRSRSRPCPPANARRREGHRRKGGRKAGGYKMPKMFLSSGTVG